MVQRKHRLALADKRTLGALSVSQKQSRKTAIYLRRSIDLKDDFLKLIERNVNGETTLCTCIITSVKKSN